MMSVKYPKIFCLSAVDPAAQPELDALDQLPLSLSVSAGWALCGHELPAGAAEDEDADACDADVGYANRASDAPTPAHVGLHAGDRSGRDAASRKKGGQAAALERECSSESVSDSDSVLELAVQAAEAVQAVQAQAGSAAPLLGEVAEHAPPSMSNGTEPPAQEKPGLFNPARTIPRSERMAIGMKAKQLLDMGRLLWLQARVPHAELVCYVPEEVSGENRLLLGVM